MAMAAASRKRTQPDAAAEGYLSSDDEPLYVPLKQRRQMAADKAAAARARHAKQIDEQTKDEEEEADDTVDNSYQSGPKAGRSLLDQRTAALADPNYREKTEAEKVAEEEKELIAAVSERAPMIAAKELAEGVSYTTALSTNWRPPKHIRDMGPAEIEEIRDCLLYTSPSPRDGLLSRMPSSA